MIGVEPIKDERARSQIASNNPAEIRRWAKRLKVTTDQLQCAIEKVGNSVVAVRKQIGVK